MNRTGCVAVCASFVLAATVPAPGQTPQKVGLIQYLQIGHAGVTGDLLAAAELMPDADYGFKPTQMPDARTFAGVISHASSAMRDACARLAGVTSSGPQPDSASSSKAAVVQTLREAIAACEKPVAALDEVSGGEYVRQGPAEAPRSAVLAGLVAHNAEMYGIATVYLRARNIVPPASR